MVKAKRKSARQSTRKSRSKAKSKAKPKSVTVAALKRAVDAYGATVPLSTSAEAAWSWRAGGWRGGGGDGAASALGLPQAR